MTQPLLNERSARDIDAVISKILRDLGNPEPPLRLELVRELLALDRQYYSSADTGMLQDVVHRLRVGAKQAVRRPSLLLDLVKTWNLSALWIPDRRRILIDSELHSAKHRWNEAHEIGHSIIPWHADVAHGDHGLTLSVACHVEVEAEANFAAGRLLFLGDRFTKEIRGGSIGLARVRNLASTYGNTITSTLWRAVESLDSLAFGLVSQHPVGPIDSAKPIVEHFITRREFRALFPSATGNEIHRALRGFCRGGRGPLGSGDVLLMDVAGEEHVFATECFCNGYSALTLGLHTGVRKLVVGVIS